MKVFNSLVEKHKDKFNETLMFGTPISELESDELRACICVLGELDIQKMKEHQRERSMLNLFRKKGI